MHSAMRKQRLPGAPQRPPRWRTIFQRPASHHGPAPVFCKALQKVLFDRIQKSFYTLRVRYRRWGCFNRGACTLPLL